MPEVKVKAKLEEWTIDDDLKNTPAVRIEAENRPTGFEISFELEDLRELRVYHDHDSPDVGCEYIKIELVGDGKRISISLWNDAANKLLAAFKVLIDKLDVEVETAKSK